MDELKIHYRYRQTVYHITITRLTADSGDQSYLALDGQELTSETIPLVDDRREHFAELKVGSEVIVPGERTQVATVPA